MFKDKEMITILKSEFERLVKVDLEMMTIMGIPCSGKKPELSEEKPIIDEEDKSSYSV